MRRGVEPAAPPGAPRAILIVAQSRTALVRELRELIEALDRRVPRVDRSGEASIAHDAAALRTRALERLAELDAPDH